MEKSGLSRLGKYEVLGSLARGGMAEILLGRTVGVEGFERLVVLKRVLPWLRQEQVILNRFLNEARLAATLHHSNIVQVFDVGIEGEERFIAMEYLRGRDLAGILNTLRAAQMLLPIEHALSIVIGICAGLDHAHRQRDRDGGLMQIVHRDVAPDNVFVTFDGGIKLVDFGIAKALQASSHTRTGSVPGKVPYMSPEQTRAEELDARTDIFSVAIVLWEMTTGQRLFKRSSDLEILKAISDHDAPPPSSVVPGYPIELEQIVMKGLKRDRMVRYQTIEAMLLDLESFARSKRLALSTIDLGRFMRDLFPGEADSPTAVVPFCSPEFPPEDVVFTRPLGSGEDFPRDALPPSVQAKPTWSKAARGTAILILPLAVIAIFWLMRSSRVSNSVSARVSRESTPAAADLVPEVSLPVAPPAENMAAEVEAAPVKPSFPKEPTGSSMDNRGKVRGNLSKASRARLSPAQEPRTPTRSPNPPPINLDDPFPTR